MHCIVIIFYPQELSKTYGTTKLMTKLMVEMSVEAVSVHWKVCQCRSSWQSARVNWVKALSIKSSSNTQFNSNRGHYASASMLKHIEFLKHLQRSSLDPPPKNRKTGQCTRWINSSENKTYSGPKTPFNEVPRGKDRWIINSRFSSLSIESIECQSDFPPSCQEDEVNVTVIVPAVFMTFQLLFEFSGLGSVNIWAAETVC